MIVEFIIIELLIIEFSIIELMIFDSFIICEADDTFDLFKMVELSIIVLFKIIESITLEQFLTFELVMDELST